MEASARTGLALGKEKQRTVETHAKHLAFLQRHPETQYLILGDSMVERFLTTGLQELKRLRKFRCALTGVGGDGVQHMIWRLEHGLMEACPKHLRACIVLAGTNNIECASEEKVLNGVRAMLTLIRVARPGLKVFVLGLLPRSSTVKKLTDEALMVRVGRFNEGLRGLTQDFGNAEYVFFGGSITGENGLKKDEFFDDHVHLNAAGYRVFADSLVHLLQQDQGRSP
mmetsp:Transcript_36185/g.82471  ORF Transcript_36185/g.82471 Transcript_36185/m.82471 type:complete len:226 (-) Transcript_36185:59-736(-)